MRAVTDAIKRNLFPSAHAAISDWDAFPWHEIRGQVQTVKPESSQALAIDVFGTICVSEDRDTILAAMAEECDIPYDGPWKLLLEWSDPDNLLKEPRPTQVDAIAFGARSILIIECKFTETAGGCSQPKPIGSGANKGIKQCNGNYQIQTNPVNGLISNCALTAKGVLYWERIPQLFGISSHTEHHPCPFKGENYQWMRNVVLADCLASKYGVQVAVIAAFADVSGLPTADKAKTGMLGLKSAHRDSLVWPMSYQSIISMARSLSGNQQNWDSLVKWVDAKVLAAMRKKHTARQLRRKTTDLTYHYSTLIQQEH
jgi:hypothetical protein